MKRNTRQPKKLCLVLDNPGRDLLGLGLLSYQLARRGMQVDSGSDVRSTGSCREGAARSDRCELCTQGEPKAAGTIQEIRDSSGVLDTEGGILRSEYRELLNIVLESGALPAMIDDYFLWGHRQYRPFVNNSARPDPGLHLTGCPRFDLYSIEWSGLIPDPPGGDCDYVLFATSFPLNNPRFTTPEQEIRNVQETMGLDEETMRKPCRRPIGRWRDFSRWCGLPVLCFPMSGSFFDRTPSKERRSIGLGCPTSPIYGSPGKET